MNSFIFILGNGPSLRGFNFHQITGQDCVGMNAAYRHWHRINWYPKYYTCLDTVMIEQHHEAIQDLVLNFGDRITLFFLRKNLLKFCPDLKGHPQILFFDDYIGNPFFGDGKKVTTGSFACLFAAMLGYRQMYLLGIDQNLVEKIPEAKHVGGHILEITETPKHNPNYFIDDYQQKGEKFNAPNSLPNLHYESWVAVRQRLENFGVVVVNCSPISNLDLFNRVPLSNVLINRRAGVSPLADSHRVNKGKLVIFGINIPNGFSGGRYHAWFVAEAAAENGWDVTFITDNYPSFYKDFDDLALYPKHKDIKVSLCHIRKKDCTLPSIDCDFLIVIPHNDCHGPFTENALRFAEKKGARISLLNFESPNWFNSLSPVKRDEKKWDGWKQVASKAAMIFSLSEEGTKYAREFYTDIAPDTQFAHLWPTINTRLADSLPKCDKEKRVVVFTRFSNAEHKGGNLIKEIICKELKGYTLVFIIGVGEIAEVDLTSLREVAYKFGVELEFKSKITEKEKWRELQRASLLIYPSYFEGFGLPPVEAQYAGTPCVAFELPVLREVSGDNIYFVPPGDLAAVKSAIAELLGSAVDGERLKRTIGERVGYDIFLRRVDYLIERMNATPPKLLHIKEKSGKPNNAKSSEKVVNVGMPSLLTGISKCEVNLRAKLITVTGWTLPSNDDIKLEVYVDGRLFGQARKGLLRADVLAKYPEYGESHAGWVFSGAIVGEGPIQTVEVCAVQKGNVLNRYRTTTEFKYKDLSNQKKVFAEEFKLYWSCLKGAHKGERGFVIGNGPSLRLSDLEKLTGEITIASNKVFLSFSETKWRPTLYTVADALVIEKTKHLLSDVCDPIHVPENAAKRLDNHNLRLWRDLGAIGEKPDVEPTVSGDLMNGAYAGHTITFFNVQLAIHLGLNPIYLVGCDHYYAGENDSKADQLVQSKADNHFIKGYRQPGEVVNAAPIKLMTLAYEHLRAYGERKGVKIINATRGGHLEVFPRTKLDELFEAEKARRPKVSICIPVLNGMPYLRECLDSIRQQQLNDCEVVICDGYSDDGSYELLSEFARKLPSVRLFQNEPKGIYDGINACIIESSGDYIYILMSDDIMAPGCLPAMTQALEENAHCGICHCRLEIINAEGNKINDTWEGRPIAKFLGSLIRERHIRLKPHDAITMFGIGTTYTSLTQILVRRSVYAKVGLFRSDYRAYGDLEWQMRAATEFSCVFLPERLAYWRRHEQQASQQQPHIAARKDGVFKRMGEEHYARLVKHFPAISQALAKTGLHEVYARDYAAIRSGQKENQCYEDLDLLIQTSEKIGMGDLCYRDVREALPEHAFVTKQVDVKAVYGTSVGARITDDLIVRDATIKQVSKKRSLAVYFPRFNNKEVLTDHYHRAQCYFPVESGILEEVVMGVGPDTLDAGAMPEHMCSPRQPVNVRLIDDIDAYIEALSSAKIVLAWRSLTKEEKEGFMKLGSQVWNIVTDDPESHEYGER
ncbi:MAG: glycosyltransferase [Desulfatirhabdiaceae bacterium]